MRSLKVSLPQLPSSNLGLRSGQGRNLRTVSHQWSQSSSAPVGQGAARVSAWRWPRGTRGPHWGGPAHGENPPRKVLSGREAGPTGWDAPPTPAPPLPRRAGPYKVSAAPLALPEWVSSPVTACSLAGLRGAPFQGRAPQRIPAGKSRAAPPSPRAVLGCLPVPAGRRPQTTPWLGPEHLCPILFCIWALNPRRGRAGVGGPENEAGVRVENQPPSGMSHPTRRLLNACH